MRWTPRVNVTPSGNNSRARRLSSERERLRETGYFFNGNERGCSLRCDRAQFSHSRFAARRLLPDKGKPTARWGRKATDQDMGLMAGLPKEGELTRLGNGGLPA